MVEVLMLGAVFFWGRKGIGARRLEGEATAACESTVGDGKNKNQLDA